MSHPVGFPRAADLEEKRSWLRRADLDAPRRAFALPAEQCVRLPFCRIRELGRFWDGAPTSGYRILHERMQAALSGFYERGCSVAFVLSGDVDAVQVHVGINAPSPGSEALLRRMLGSLFPGVGLAPGDDAGLAARTMGLGHCVAMTGIPALPPRGERHVEDRDRTDRLVRGMSGTRWGYLVLARPLPLEDVTAWFELLGEEQKWTVAEYMRPGVSGVERENNPAAEHYVKLLKMSRERFASGRANGMWETKTYLFADSEATLHRGRAALMAAFSGPEEVPQPLRLHPCVVHPSGPQVPSSVLNTAELATLMLLPSEEAPGYRVRRFARFASDLPKAGDAQTLAVGRTVLPSGAMGAWLEIPVRDLTKHAFVGGQTGAGKTTAVMFLLSQLWREHRVPWLVIEPKEDYRSFLASDFGDDVRVLTLGDERVAPLRFNPLMAQPGASVQAHVGFVRALFSAAFVLYPPMPYVLDQALHRVYERMGWDLVSNRNRRGEGARAFPTISDLVQEVEAVIQEAGYDRELTMNIRAGLVARLNGLRLGTKGRMLDVRQGLSLEELVAKPTILETGNIGDPEEAAFLLGSILVAIYEHRKAQGKSDGLQHLLVLEEAHRLLQNAAAAEAGPDKATMRAAAIERFCEILAEMRAYGQGVVVCEQIPTKIVPDVVKNSSLKLLFRTPAKDDRDLVGAAMNMDEPQKAYVASLCPGEAVASAEATDRPFLIRVPDATRQTRANERPSERDIAEHMRKGFYAGSSARLEPFEACKECSLKAMCGDVQPVVRTWLATSPGQSALSRMNVAVITGERVVQAWGEFVAAVGSLFPKSDLRFAIGAGLCAAHHASERNHEAKGRLFNWPFGTVDGLAASFSRACQKLAKTLVAPDGGDSTGLEQEVAAYRQAYHAACKEARASHCLCEPCTGQCLYRLEVGQLVADPSLSRHFLALASDLPADEDTAALAELAVRAARCIVPDGNPAALLAVSRCFAGQALARLDLPAHEVEELGVAIATALEPLTQDGKSE